MVFILVTGISWYQTANNETFALPSETAVGLSRVLQGIVEGKFAHLLLPEGTLDLQRRSLPIAPVPIDQVFPLGAAAVTWLPDPDRWQIGSDVPVLSKDWPRLFKERSAFTPWGDEEDAEAFTAFLRRFGPRPTFRESLNRKEIRFIYPQFLEPRLCYRLSAGFRRLPDQAAYSPVVVLQEQLRLESLEGDAVVTFGPGEFGWVARSYASAAEAGIGKIAGSATPRSVDELQQFVGNLGQFWRLVPTRREANLVLPGR